LGQPHPLAGVAQVDPGRLGHRPGPGQPRAEQPTVHHQPTVTGAPGWRVLTRNDWMDPATKPLASGREAAVTPGKHTRHGRDTACSYVRKNWSNASTTHGSKQPPPGRPGKEDGCSVTPMRS